MAQAGFTPISLYFSTTAAAVPTSGNLVAGELALNTLDGKLYYKNSAGTVTLLASTAGAAGDVVGPASATDNALARFDLTTGKLIQNSVGILSDAGILTGLTGITSSGSITFSSLTSGRVTFAGASGLLTDSANLTWNGTSLSATQIDITAQGPLRLQDTTGGEYVGLRSPASLGASYTLTFPADDGTSGQALITDGSGVLSWSTAASGDVYGPASATANGIALFDGTTGKLLKDSAATDGLIYGLTVGRGANSVADNTAFGVSALRINSTGSANTAVGYQAGYTNSTGAQLTAIGYQAGYSSNGSNNTFVGYYAGILTSSGADNVALGSGALLSNSTASSNTAVGKSALQSNTTASSNTAVGYQAAFSNTTGALNVAVGTRALQLNSTSSDNTAVGYEAAQATTGAANTAIGKQTLANNTSGANNSALGKDALLNNTTASNNTAVGYQAGYANTTGAQGTYIGVFAGYDVTTGTYNSFLGYGSGVNVTTGSKNTIIGSYNGNQNSVDIRTSSNYIVLSDGDGYPAFWGLSGSSGYMRLQAGRLEFPPTANPSTDPNTLDDYEEGTFTPSITTQGGSITTLGAVSGNYTKIGNTVFLWITIAITTVGTATGDCNIGGLPFSASQTGAGTGINSSNVVISVRQGSGTTALFANATNGGSAMANNTNYVISINYFV